MRNIKNIRTIYPRKRIFMILNRGIGIKIWGLKYKLSLKVWYQLNYVILLRDRE